MNVQLQFTQSIFIYFRYPGVTSAAFGAFGKRFSPREGLGLPRVSATGPRDATVPAGSNFSMCGIIRFPNEISSRCQGALAGDDKQRRQTHKLLRPKQTAWDTSPTPRTFAYRNPGDV